MGFGQALEGIKLYGNATRRHVLVYAGKCNDPSQHEQRIDLEGRQQIVGFRSWIFPKTPAVHFDLTFMI
jgi:hypothetical protein